MALPTNDAEDVGRYGQFAIGLVFKLHRGPTLGASCEIITTRNITSRYYEDEDAFLYCCNINVLTQRKAGLSMHVRIVSSTLLD